MNISFKLYKNKYFEFQVEWISEWTEYIEFMFKFNRRTDHAGLHISFAVMKFWWIFTIYDNRHWDYENNRWCIYE